MVKQFVFDECNANATGATVDSKWSCLITHVSAYHCQFLLVVCSLGSQHHALHFGYIYDGTHNLTYLYQNVTHFVSLTQLIECI